MAASMDEILSLFGPPKLCKILSIKVKNKYVISKGTLIATYKSVDDKKGSGDSLVAEKFKANVFGTVEEILVNAGDVLNPGTPILKYSPCSHPTVMKDMCAECGADLRETAGFPGQRSQTTSASVAMVHSIPELQVSKEEALKLANQDEERLLKSRKLTLVVDLDQTVIHTTMENVKPNLPGVKHFQLWGSGQQTPWYHTKIRPGCKKFFEVISKYYELHIFTMGARLYAHTIAGFLDPDQRFFSHRILSRDECFDRNSKTANLNAIFPCGDSMVCIIDDRDDVWNCAPNLIQVRPYRYFEGTGDINTPPGLPSNIPSASKAVSTDKKSKGDDKAEDDMGEEGDDEHDTQNTAEIKTDSKSDCEKDESNNDSCYGKESDSKAKDDSGKTDVCGQEQRSKGKDQEQRSEGKSSKVKPSEDDELKDDSGKTDGDVCGDQNKSECEVEGDVSVTKEVSERTVTDDDKKTSTDSVKHTKSANENQGSEKDLVEKTQGDCSEQKSSDQEQCSEQKSSDQEQRSEGKDQEQRSEGKSSKVKPSEDDELKEDCQDDYFLHLEDILIRIHGYFFKIYDKSQDKTLPVAADQKQRSEGKSSKVKPVEADLKWIVPHIRRKVLFGTYIVFSGVFPTNMPPEQSRAWKTAVAMGAQVATNIIPRDKTGGGPLNATTHLIAAKVGTNKVHYAQRCKKIHIVTVEWLFCCWERWERTDERLFILPGIKPISAQESTPPNSDSDASSKRAPHSKKRKGTPDGKTKPKQKRAKTQGDSGIDEATSANSATQSGPRASLSSEYNPLYSFSSEELQNMDKEVQDIFGDESSSDEDDATSNQDSLGSITQMISSSSEESLSGENPRGWSPKRKRRESDSDKEDSGDSTSSPGMSDDGRGDYEDEDMMADAIDDLLSYSKVPTVKDRLNLQQQ